MTSSIAVICGAIVGALAVFGVVVRALVKVVRAADDWKEISGHFRENREGTSIPQRLSKVEAIVSDLSKEAHGR